MSTRLTERARLDASRGPEQIVLRDLDPPPAPAALALSHHSHLHPHLLPLPRLDMPASGAEDGLSHDKGEVGADKAVGLAGDLRERAV